MNAFKDTVIVEIGNIGPDEQYPPDTGDYGETGHGNDGVDH